MKPEASKPLLSVRHDITAIGVQFLDPDLAQMPHDLPCHAVHRERRDASPMVVKPPNPAPLVPADNPQGHDRPIALADANPARPFDDPRREFRGENAGIVIGGLADADHAARSFSGNRSCGSLVVMTSTRPISVAQYGDDT